MLSVFESVTHVAIPALAGLIAGVAGSLIAPWVHWGIEKRRQRLERRKKAIDDCRAALTASGYQFRDFRESAVYSAVRPFLSEETRKGLEGEATHVQMGGRGAGCPHRRRILDELAKLESTWGLV